MSGNISIDKAYTTQKPSRIFAELVNDFRNIGIG